MVGKEALGHGLPKNRPLDLHGACCAGLERTVPARDVGKGRKPQSYRHHEGTPLMNDPNGSPSRV